MLLLSIHNDEGDVTVVVAVVDVKATETAAVVAEAEGEEVGAVDEEEEDVAGAVETGTTAKLKQQTRHTVHKHIHTGIMKASASIQRLG